jgi:hypothetical protein
MTPVEARERFAARLQHQRDAATVRKAVVEALQQLFDEDVIAAARSFYKKSKAKPILTADAAAWLLRKQGLYEQISKPYEEKATQIFGDSFAQDGIRDCCLNILAETAEVRPGPEWRTVKTFRSSDYSTQPACVAYAAGNARVREIELLSAGVPIRREEEHGVYKGSEHWPTFSERRWYKCAVQAQVAEDLDVEILRRRTVPLREWVRLCWANGINPRVMSPFLPFGYEEKVGIDYQGRDLLKIKEGSA